MKNKQKDKLIKVKLIQDPDCNQCEGKGYTEIRDCAGEIQRTETCSFCEGLGQVSR